MCGVPDGLTAVLESRLGTVPYVRGLLAFAEIRLPSFSRIALVKVLAPVCDVSG